ncbi:unnamed protein product [Bathycoccus prasinos]
MENYLYFCWFLFSFGDYFIVWRVGHQRLVAGALCVFVYETITRWYYKTSRPGRKLEFVNCFKLGLVYSLIADAFKLGS